MFVGFLRWWYTDGVKDVINSRKENLAHISDFFSVELLLNTLFMPFRQISSGSVRGPLAAQVQAVLDNLISRIIGLFVRSFMILGAGAALFGTFLYAGVVLVLWLLVPLLPVIGLVLALSGISL